MNRYKKFAPNVFVAACEEKYNKGDEITLTTRRGDEHECIVWNYLGQDGSGKHLHSITRADGFNHQEYLRRRRERLEEWAIARGERGDSWYEKSHEGREFLRLAEPIKIGHHSEGRHRALIERNRRRMDNAVENWNAAKEHSRKAEKLRKRENEINLSMPESVEYYFEKWVEASETHAYLKENPDKRPHSYALQYANKRKNDMKKRYDMAVMLWGDE